MASEDLSEHLPGDAQAAGLMLIWHRGNDKFESVNLINRNRQALYTWNYNPSLGEVRDKAMEVLKEGRAYD